MAAPSLELDGRAAIVTGAGQGVGRGIALALAAAGARVMLHGRTAAKVEAVRDEIVDAGGTAATAAGDVATAGDVQRCIDTTVEAFGTVDILVNNAISQPLGPLLDIDDEVFEYGFDSGPLATLRFMRGCHPHLVDGGSVVNIGSGVALQPAFPGFGCYAAVKTAIGSLSRAAATEWGPVGIRVNMLLPLALTPAMAGFLEVHPEAMEGILGQIPLGRLGDSQADVGTAAVFLCSPAAAYITGATLTVDGGQDYVR